MVRKESRDIGTIQKDIKKYGATKILKEELRRAKNKKSARLSRARKQTKVETLERENEQLHEKVAELEQEIDKLRKASQGSIDWLLEEKAPQVFDLTAMFLD